MSPIIISFVTVTGQEISRRDLNGFLSAGAGECCSPTSGSPTAELDSLIQAIKVTAASAHFDLAQDEIDVRLAVSRAVLGSNGRSSVVIRLAVLQPKPNSQSRGQAPLALPAPTASNPKRPTPVPTPPKRPESGNSKPAAEVLDMAELLDGLLDFDDLVDTDAQGGANV